MEIKAKLTDLFQLAYEEEQRFIASLRDDERSAAGAPERWSAKDVIAHVAAWKARSVRYNLAWHYALAGEKSKAITTLGEAFRLNPALLEWSTRDSDLDTLRDELRSMRERPAIDACSQALASSHSTTIASIRSQPNVRAACKR